MAIRIDPTLHILRERVQDQIADDVASNRRSPYSEVALPLNAELLRRQERIDSQRARISQLESERDALTAERDALKEVARRTDEATEWATTHVEQIIAERDALLEQLAASQREVISLLPKVELLREALTGAADDLENWGYYVSEYFREKHKLAADIADARAALEATK